ncbi:septation protein SepH, partial [Nocardiopsis halotolerans]|uniref:septation protein SepH n=1 Tax=Nocardiopsis halotolerans TaxID=124252 RepID=UPI00036FB95E
MHELRLVAVSEDGTYLVLASTGRGTRFMLPVDDRLRAAVRGQFSRLGQYEIEVENPLRPKEIQARIRSGETAEAISEISGIPIERVRWFEGPVLQEREYIAQQAQRASVRGEAGPGPSLEELVTKRIGAHQLETGDAVWDSWKREDRSWQLKLVFLYGGEERVAHWLYEPRHNSVTPSDEEAARFSSAEPEPVSSPGANVTPFAPRRPEATAGLPRPEAQPSAELDHPATRRPSSDEPLRSAPTAHPGTLGVARPGHPAEREPERPAEHRPTGWERERPAELRSPGRERHTEPRVERPAERRQPEWEPERPMPRAEPERRPAPPAYGEPAVHGEPVVEERRPERRTEWPRDARPVRPTEPEEAPPAAEAPAPQRPAPRRRRATIDLNDNGTPRRAVDQPPASTVPA